MQIADFEAEHVAWAMEGADLSSAVRKQLADPDHAGDDLVELPAGWPSA